MLYLRCFTSNAKNMVESRDILNYNKIIRKIESDINENTTIRHTIPLSIVNIYRFFIKGDAGDKRLNSYRETDARHQNDKHRI